MTRLAAACAALALAGCGNTPHTTTYLKGAPLRVTVRKHAEPAKIRYRAVRDGTTVRVAVRSRTPVRLERTVAKSTYLLEWRGQARWEWVETLLGIPMLPLLPMLIGAPPNSVDGPDVKVRTAATIYAMFPDPRTTFLGTNVEGRFSTVDAFPAAPQTRRYRVSLPLREQTVRYQIISAERAVIAAGEATTSRFGEVALPDVPEDAVAVEVTHAGSTRLIVIE